ARNNISAGASHVLTTVFQPNPLAFLADNKIFIAGSSRIDPLQAPQNVQDCNFGYNPDRDRYEFRVDDPVNPGMARIQVESVAARHWTDQRYVPRPIPSPPLAIATT